MKTILAAVDFTAASHNAALYATELAKTFNARLVLINVFQLIPVPLSDLIVSVTPDNPADQSAIELKEEAEMLDPTGIIDIETYSVQGRADQVIAEAVNKWQPDIVIAGMKKNNKGVRRLFGSTITALIGKINVPLLVIPEDVPFTTPKAIALATDADINLQTNPHAVDTLCEIANRFYSKLYMVRIVKDVFDEIIEMHNRPVKLNQAVDQLHPEYVYPYGNNVPKTLNEFAATKHITMLAMIAHQHNLFERWFVTSTTRAMSFATNIPLLIVPEKK
jgi:nucleotide-binding universal stress UspA family protein